MGTGWRIFSLTHARSKAKNIFLYFFTDLKNLSSLLIYYVYVVSASQFFMSVGKSQMLSTPKSFLIFYLVFTCQGQAFVNGFNIGRYWPVVGPQITLYVPASILNSGKAVTEVVLLELDNAPCEDPKDCFVDFVETPVIDGPVRPMTSKQILPDEVYDDWTAKYKDFLPSYVKTKKQVLDILSSRL